MHHINKRKEKNNMIVSIDVEKSTWQSSTSIHDKKKALDKVQHPFMIKNHWGTWVAQSVKSLILDFSLGYDLTICGIEPYVGLCTGSVEHAWDSLSPSLSLSPVHILALPLSQDK